ncbi:primase-like DNA-binding domain-containing protein [Mesorhizobium sp. M6A.T.Cr.TU.017.01.1.1]|uniref:primase-like DNA-binding domain-containing protein n=1 Tax=Mesorhizobium sp. M6A.T.Cr.TU.017.01.1.1 TaxID=2496774 RepID=UPI0013E346DF|nr:primase-like DNA-binding domain-containing protein [Mesorhizobium sp. M6A.T.Cr.TU.017.01.1.1]
MGSARRCDPRGFRGAYSPGDLRLVAFLVLGHRRINAAGKEKPIDLYHAFEKFAAAEGVFAFNRSTFEKRFAKSVERSFEGPDGQMKQFQKARSNGETFYRGIGIRIEWQSQGGDHGHREDER